MREPTYTSTPWRETYSEIIDVRSPAEYAEDRIPGAINLPVLDNQERAKIGTIYKQVSPFEARKLGASLVAANISHYLQTHFLSKNKDYSPLVYCWRGGNRSHSLALILSQIGWYVTVVTGGYKTYRNYVREQLNQLPLKFTYKILSGLTGTGKTEILRRLAKRDIQVLDLEALANHRGSLLGQEWEVKPEPQPSQKDFESRLLQRLQKFDANQPVWVESESNKIGQIYLPSALWEMMKKASCLEIKVPLAARIDWLLQEYPHLVENADFLKNKLDKLNSRYGCHKVKQWKKLIDQNEWHSLIGDLLVTHYDPAYRRSLSRAYYPRLAKTVQVVDLSAKSLDLALLKFLAEV
ncbi:tRNA 2-selenouridine(34) synthase MnmH [Oscillatoria salina]|uniref:tRNA 2-selenouridine(34) synthase MnmH n=1 Tax=Oscillatoria salina TaxID=331517 RepID=UPI0013BD635A|nr:tRNA 2-selenouridine(34) synthase MnmH [Oscillatoria salina]MBZ8180170.1 tRNA 2-selenouridine(34) synthase MnmH [Oscillatoria salina IIICB1]NET88593.1 tRNA 2-selenouridine(34) synthase MnmH [Kamptonema sp. SIO1D9]